MKAWYSKVRDTELIDGSVRADYVVTFETDNFELKRKVEKYLQGIMDEAEQTEPQICDFCRYYNNNIPCGTTPSACKKADKFAKEFVDGLKKLKPKDEPQTDCDGCQHYADKHTADACYECKRSYADCYEPQTDCPKSCPSIDICTKDNTDCAWK